MASYIYAKYLCTDNIYIRSGLLTNIHIYIYLRDNSYKLIGRNDIFENTKDSVSRTEIFKCDM